MNIDALVWALQLRTGDPLDKLLLLVMADQADHDGRCNISSTSLAAKTEMTERHIRARLECLERRGFIRREIREHPAGGRTLVSVLCVPSAPQP